MADSRTLDTVRWTVRSYWDADGHAWSDELTEAQRVILEPPSSPVSDSLQAFRQRQAKI